MLKLRYTFTQSSLDFVHPGSANLLDSLAKFVISDVIHRFGSPNVMYDAAFSFFLAFQRSKKLNPEFDASRV